MALPMASHKIDAPRLQMLPKGKNPRMYGSMVTKFCSLCHFLTLFGPEFEKNCSKNSCPVKMKNVPNYFSVFLLYWCFFALNLAQKRHKICTKFLTLRYFSFWYRIGIKNLWVWHRISDMQQILFPWELFGKILDQKMDRGVSEKTLKTIVLSSVNKP